MFSTTLSHLIPARPFVISPIQPYLVSAMAGNLFSGIFLTLYCHSNFLTSLFCKKYFKDVSREFDEFQVNTHLYLFQVGTFLVLLLILYCSSYLSILASF